MFQLDIFSSRFNVSVNTRSRTFVVPVSKVSSALLFLLYKEGYIFNYTLYKNNSYLVYPNHKAIPFKLVRFSTSSNRRFFGPFRLKKFSNRGSIFIVKTSRGYIFSDVALIHKFSGVEPVFYLKHFYL
jgi:ribosomal protein S8